MQFSESWLRTLVNPSLSGEELAHLLTMAGLEVEGMAPVAPAFDSVVVAEVLNMERHPDADRLNVLTVNAGLAEPLAIVCGAQNVRVGMKAPCALVGAKLPGIEIKQAKVRGIASFGMMCSAGELGLAAESEGLLELAADAKIGRSVREHLDLDDRVITLKLTPNRSDCLSLRGIAREVAALTGAPLSDVPAATFEPATERKVNVRVSVPAACPRYSGRVISGVNAQATTPAWMVQRLQRCGLRSISALVDVTNYVLLELGQPLHAFDLGRLQGDIEVRFARDGESLKLLNEQTIALQDDMLVIADERQAVALAGVMGGAESAVDETTTDVFLESAFFSPAAIAGKTRRIGVASDSAYRFERGVDFAMTEVALDRATRLILEICGGRAGAVSAVLNELPQRSPIRLRSARVQRVLGVALESGEIGQALTGLGMAARQDGDEFLVMPPSYRFDIGIEEDLIEEVARVHGYDNIRPAPIQARMTLLPLVEAERPLAGLRRMMVSRDYQEVINYAFVDSSWERDLCGNATPVALKNPIASQMDVMRSSLLGGLLANLRTNLARKQPRVRLFEIGGCFSAEAGHYLQDDRLAALAYGGVVAEQWGVSARVVDFFDVKGDIEALFAPRRVVLQAAHHPASHPGRSARILVDGRPVGWVGELHPQWQQQNDLPQPALWFEIELAALKQGGIPRPGGISRFPPVRRDIAVVVDEAVTAQSLLDAMRSCNAPHVVDVGLFDLYRGAGVGEGRKSLAFRVLLQDTQGTLTDSEIEPGMSALTEVLQKNGAQIRGES